MATVIATDDLLPAVVEDFCRDCGSILNITDRRFMAFCSVDTPSFVKLLADPTEWVIPLKIAATALLVQIGKNAGDDLWKNKAAIGKALAQAAVAPLRKIIQAFHQIKKRGSASTYVAVALPIPNDVDSTLVVIPTDSEEEAAVTLAIFVDQAEAIVGAVREQIEAGRSLVFGVRALPQTDGSVLLKWVDEESGQEKYLLLPCKKSD